MAAASDKGMIMLSVGALVVLLVVMAQPMEVMAQQAQQAQQPQLTAASTFEVYSGACSGSPAILNACGCNNISPDTLGGYSFAFSGQTATAYNQANCKGVVQASFNANTQQCSGVGWQSVFINC